MLVLSLMLRNPSFATWHRCWWRWKSPQQQRRRRRRRQWRRRRWQQLSQVPCLLQVWPACTMPASWPALLACLLQYLYFHDSNEVVIHFSVKLMMLQNLLDLLTLKRWFNQYWLKIIDYVFFFSIKSRIQHSSSKKKPQSFKKNLLLLLHTYTSLGHPYLQFFLLLPPAVLIFVYKKQRNLYCIHRPHFFTMCAKRQRVNKKPVLIEILQQKSGGIFYLALYMMLCTYKSNPSYAPFPHPPKYMCKYIYIKGSSTINMECELHLRPQQLLPFPLLILYFPWYL